MEIAAIEMANKTSNDLSGIGTVIKGLINPGKTIIAKRDVGSPKKPVGRPEKKI
jgi:hypothetical protein